MTPSEIVNLVIAIVSVIPTLVSVGVLVYNIIKNKNWNLVMKIADSAMKEVEDYAKQHPGMTSDEKLEMALNGVEAGLKVAGINLDKDALKRLVEYIKESINWFNEMNGR